MCSACSDENLDPAGNNSFRGEELTQQITFADRPSAGRKHYRTRWGRTASRLFQQIVRLRERVPRGEDGWHEIGFYLGGLVPSLPREPQEILVSSDVIVEVHKGKRGPRNRARRRADEGGKRGWR